MSAHSDDNYHFKKRKTLTENRRRIFKGNDACQSFPKSCIQHTKAILPPDQRRHLPHIQWKGTSDREPKRRRQAPRAGGARAAVPAIKKRSHSTASQADQGSSSSLSGGGAGDAGDGGGGRRVWGGVLRRASLSGTRSGGLDSKPTRRERAREREREMVLSVR